MIPEVLSRKKFIPLTMAIRSNIRMVFMESIFTNICEMKLVKRKTKSDENLPQKNKRRMAIFYDAERIEGNRC